MRLAPGPAEVPHDLVHFVVEEQARLRLGIYGQAAAGGDVGGFFRSTPGKRGRAQSAKRSRRVGNAGRSDVELSERLAGLAWTGQIPDDVDRTIISPALFTGINTRLAEVLAQWRRVPHGGDLVLHWPAELTLRRGQLPARADTNGYSSG